VFPEALAREIEATATATYITPVLLGQATVHEFVSRGLFEPNLERVKKLLGARRDAMLAAFDRELPDVSITRPDGGYFLWAELDGVDAGKLLGRAEAGGVTFVKGTDFDGGPDSLRLAYSFVSVDEIAEGVARLAAAMPVAA
jgi:DNA-binding transcriptional MocR family regulator